MVIEIFRNKIIKIILFLKELNNNFKNTKTPKKEKEHYTLASAINL